VTLARRLAPLFTAMLTSPRTRDLRRAVAEQRRKLGGEPHRVHWFHAVDDPYAHLVAQLLPAFVARWAIELVPHLVGPPSDAAAPEREKLAAFARRDVADVAPGYGLAFPPESAQPTPERVAAASRILARAIETGAFVAIAARVGDALWSGGDGALAAIEDEHGAASDAAVARAVADGNALRAKRGHYLGAMLFYGGEWYWGVDRLSHLERRLRALGLARTAEASRDLAPRPDPSRDPAPAARSRVTLEVFPSLRSPYTAIVMDRVLDLPKRLPVDLRLRPVLPMVMRGLPVPREKQLYIVLDAKREADDAGVAFGRVCDPVGRPVERCFSLYAWARERGCDAALLRSFTHAAFAEGVDTSSDAGLRLVVERAGLVWSEALDHLDRDGWRAELEVNRETLFALGLWGVPSFRILARGDDPDETEYATWGQDRLWRVEQEIRRRVQRA
jgi:2-hydroxychromene-2-carboxylate isomerase